MVPYKETMSTLLRKNEFHCIKPIIFFLLILFTLSNLETGRQFFIPSLILIDFPEQSWCIAFSSLLSTSIQFYFIKSSKAKQIIIIISKEYNECVWIAIYEQYNECFPFQFFCETVCQRRCGSVPKNHLTCAISLLEDHTWSWLD